MTDSNKENKADARQVINRPFLGVFYKTMRKLVKSTPILTAAFATIIILVITSLLFGSYKILIVLTQDLTTTVTAATESLSFSLRDKAQSSWVLPPGEFLILDKPEGSLACKDAPRVYENISQGFTCTTPSRVRLVIEGAAKIKHEVKPDGKWSMEISGNNDTALTSRLLDDNDAVIAKFIREFGFSADLGDQEPSDTELRKDYESVRIPIIATTAKIGSDVHYASGIRGELGDFWQPTLLSGNVSTFARNYPEEGKYQILSERLDSGDTIGIETEKEPTQDEPDDLIWGVATIEHQTVLRSDTTEVEQYVIYAVLHTTHRKLSVLRFGSGVHHISASGWSIISKWPNGQETWVAFISAILIMTFVLQLADSLNRKPLKSRKKGKKHRKRKRKGD